MKVRELIDFLSKQNPDADVYSVGDDGCTHELDEDDIDVGENRIHV